MNSIKSLLLIAVLSLAAGCASTNPMVKPTRSFLDTVGEEYLDYVEGDVKLDENAKRARRANVEAFRMLIEEAGK